MDETMTPAEQAVYAEYRAAYEAYERASQVLTEADEVIAFRLQLGVSQAERIEGLKELLGHVDEALKAWNDVTAIVAGLIPRLALLTWLEHYRSLNGTKARLRETLELEQIGQAVELELATQERGL